MKVCLIKSIILIAQCANIDIDGEYLCGGCGSRCHIIFCLTYVNTVFHEMDYYLESLIEKVVFNNLQSYVHD